LPLLKFQPSYIGGNPRGWYLGPYDDDDDDDENIISGLLRTRVKSEYSCFNYITDTSPNAPPHIYSSTIDAMPTGWW